LYRQGRSPKETFFDWIDRIGPASLKEAFKDLQQLPAPDADPQAYRDWGQEEDFTLQVNDSECAA
jgi:hypothetical protein